jgi:Cu/Ag efflux pump CusA
MIALLVAFSLRQRILVIGLTCVLSVVGIFAFQSIPIDAYPDVTNIQVQVLTEAAGLSPVEVERFITYPLELQMTGLPGLAVSGRSRNSRSLKLRWYFKTALTFTSRASWFLSESWRPKSGYQRDSSR